ELMMKTEGLTKMIIKRSHETDKILLMDWGMPLESLFYSAINNEGPLRTFAVLSDDEIKRRVTAQQDSLVSAFINLSMKDLNQRYFPIDTIYKYNVKDSL